MFNYGSNGYSLSDIAAVTDSNRDGNDFGGNGAWWIIILFLFMFMGWGRNGWDNNGGSGATGSGAEGQLTRAALYDGFTTNGIERSLAGIQSGLCDGFYAMNTGMLNGFNTTNVALMQGQNALASQLADCCCSTKGVIQQAAFDNLQGQNAIARQISDCCCENGRQIERGFADVNYNMATNTCAIQTSLASSTRDIIDSQNAGTRAILDYLCQEKISDLQNENQTLRLAASQQAQNNYLVSQLGTKAPVPAYVVANPYCNCGTAYGCGLTA